MVNEMRFHDKEDSYGKFFREDGAKSSETEHNKLMYLTYARPSSNLKIGLCVKRHWRL